MIAFDANQWITSSAKRATKKKQDKRDELLEELRAQVDRDGEEQEKPVLFPYYERVVAWNGEIEEKFESYHRNLKVQLI